MSCRRLQALFPCGRGVALIKWTILERSRINTCVIILYYGQFEHYGYCENWIADALDRAGHYCLRIRRTPWFDESRMLTIARQNGATHVLLSKCPEIEVGQLEALKQAGLKIVFWTFDWMRHPEAWSWYGPLAKIADLCFQTDGCDLDGFYKAEGIRRVELHQACVPGLHDLPSTANIEDYERGAALTFIGSEYTERRHELVRRLGLISVGLGAFKKWGEPQPVIWGRDFAAAVYYSKMVVGDNFVNDVPGYWSDRVYLTLACGGFFATAYVPGLEEKFTNHEHLVWWRSFEELETLVEYYMPREAKRKAIALTGYRQVQQFDTYSERMKTFNEHVERLK